MAAEGNGTVDLRPDVSMGRLLIISELGWCRGTAGAWRAALVATGSQAFLGAACENGEDMSHRHVEAVNLTRDDTEEDPAPQELTREGTLTNDGVHCAVRS